MQAIILAGGKGLRLRAVVKNMPKSMAEIAGKPFLEYLLLQLGKSGIRDIVLSLGYKKEMIKSYFGTGRDWGLKITYSEEKKPLGTGGALRKAVKYLNQDDFIAMNGDSFLGIDFKRFIDFHRTHKGIGTIALQKAGNSLRYGSVSLNSKKEITGFSEKKSAANGLINAGVYIFKRRILNFIPKGNVSLENEVFPILCNRGLYGMRIKRFFTDIGIPGDYIKLSKTPEALLKALRK
jgi:D-glycero-alpha-D-manno-heptose 1-phosphate guanylyltransferase